MAKLNQAELDAVTWKIVQQLREQRELAVKIAQSNAKQDFEKNNKLVRAWEVLKANQKEANYKLEMTFRHPKIVDVPSHWDIKARLIISQIDNKNIDQVVEALTNQIAVEIGL
jgi:hypothetical protein